MRYYYKSKDGKGLFNLKTPDLDGNKDFVKISESDFNDLQPKAHTPSNDEIAKRQKVKRINELKSNLAKTDYEAIKFAEGEMSAEDYESYKLQRRAWRAEINQLEEELK